MKSTLSTLMAALFALMSVAVTPATTSATPLAPRLQTSSDVVDVQYRKRGPGPAFYRGHRGVRYHRPGYRYHNGYWFPAAAFLGLVIGGAIAAQAHSGNAHVRWCYNRYRSYREWDNTFQPNHGPRRRCNSPYS